MTFNVVAVGASWFDPSSDEGVIFVYEYDLQSGFWKAATPVTGYP